MSCCQDRIRQANKTSCRGFEIGMESILQGLNIENVAFLFFYFLTSFFSFAKWYPNFENVFSFPKELTGFTPLTILDYYVSDQATLNQRELVQNYSIKYFSNLTKEALLLEDHLYQDVLVEAMDRLVYVAKLKNNLENEYFSAAFLNQLKGLKHSLEENNLAAN